MAIATITAAFTCDLEKVWETVTSLENYAWRSDLSRIEILNNRQFVEYTKDGYATNFTITVEEPCKRWEFDMENSNMKGHWTGIFTEENDKTVIKFTEDVTAKKLFMKPFVKSYLEKQQREYVADLRKVLTL
ncbi:MAG: SRPBCC family protein [Lachnospiraceae bacterium]|nr:SRPBCC family protein [Lachnospiraceae bacterium]